MVENRILNAIFVVAFSALCLGCGSTNFLGQKMKNTSEKPIVIAHRGASGHLPEHTLEAYRLAIEMGADFIEPDLVMTKDGILVARHENEISGTTDVAKKFPKRKTKKIIEGQAVTGWFVEDFTLNEMKTLRAFERLPSRSQKHNGKYKIPTFQEILELTRTEGQKRGRAVGIYPETKHPSYFQSIGLPLEKPLVQALSEAGLNTKTALVFVQSFEISNLKELNQVLVVPLIQLLDSPDKIPYDQVLKGSKATYAAMLTKNGLKEISTYASGIGPHKSMLITDGVSTGLLESAHAVGLKVHPYTFRSDKDILDTRYQGDPSQEYREFFKLGVDGVFSDFPDHAIAARDGQAMQCH